MDFSNGNISGYTVRVTYKVVRGVIREVIAMSGVNILGLNFEAK